jgi:radical SAM protein with 4Fe4S-binding SPASM domain
MISQVWPFVRRSPFRPRRFRPERFGGIVQLERPRALVFVDHARARALGHLDVPPLTTATGDELARLLDAPLSAPLEAHLQLTNRCSAGCQGCYTGASPEGAPREWGLDEWRRAVAALAQRGVFHLALGGGESALLPWLGELATYARSVGVVPNLTTSGLYDDDTLERLAGWAPLFGQINVSLDGLGADYASVRGVDGFARADRALVRLRRATPSVGINVVVTRHNFEALDALFAHARRRRLSEVELLRFKPSGRGARVYEELRCTDDQHDRLVATALASARRHRVRVKLDCSYTPMVVHQGADLRLLRWLAVYGCAGGDLLVGAKATGALSACSFAAPVDVSVERLSEHWDSEGAFGPFRRWREAAEEPCRSCEALSLCRGGCRVVSAHVEGSLGRPDPECARVRAHRRREGSVAVADPARLPNPVVRLPVVG